MEDGKGRLTMMRVSVEEGKGRLTMMRVSVEEGKGRLTMMRVTVQDGNGRETDHDEEDPHSLVYIGSGDADGFGAGSLHVHP